VRLRDRYSAPSYLGVNHSCLVSDRDKATSLLVWFRIVINNYNGLNFIQKGLRSDKGNLLRKTETDKTDKVLVYEVIGSKTA